MIRGAGIVCRNIDSFEDGRGKWTAIYSFTKTGGHFGKVKIKQ